MIIKYNSHRYWLNWYRIDWKDHCEMLKDDYRESLENSLKEFEESLKKYEAMDSMDHIRKEGFEGLKNQISAIKEILASENV